MQKFFQEFQAFIKRGNVLDLAVAVIIGGAFGRIVSSFVEDLFTPILGLLLGGVDFSGLSITVGEAVIGYGKFIQSIIDFVIIAFAVFLVIKIVNRFEKKQAEALPPPPPEEIVLLRDIRDLLRK
ncbi:MAG: large-conductance mechanosensitive channel protein MscL [Synechococcaceae cyanobacterium SM2_3_60]|nr:large-conductance mechanosensitive channel protein MscL [Synechococcaceae cyanobacterium SM2_3_60]